MLDSCCINIGLVFIKDRPVSSFWVLRFDLGCFVFEFWVLRFRDLGVVVFDLGCFVLEFWVLHFRDLGASCLGLCFRVLRFRNYRYFYCRWPENQKMGSAWSDWRLISSASFHTSSDNFERNTEKWNSNNRDCKKETIETWIWLRRSWGIKDVRANCFCASLLRT